MNLAMNKYQEKLKEGVSKQEFEMAWKNLLNKVHQLEHNVSQKADGVVLTMALSHRQEIELLQEKVTKLEDEIGKYKRVENMRTVDIATPIKPKRTNLFRKLFSNMKSTPEKC